MVVLPSGYTRIGSYKVHTNSEPNLKHVCAITENSEICPSPQYAAEKELAVESVENKKLL